MRSFFALIRDLFVPTGAGPGVPGWQWTTDIPAELAAVYTGSGALEAVEIAWSTTLNSYGYRGIVPGGVIVKGIVTAGVVHELERLAAGGVLLVGGEGGASFSAAVAVQLGPQAGTAAAGERMLFRNGFDLNINAGSEVTYDSDSIVAMTSWTPTLEQTTANPTAGFVSVAGRYRRQGDKTDFFVVATVLDATKAGTGRYRFATPHDLGLDSQTCGGVYVDASTGSRVYLHWDLDSSGAGTMETYQLTGAGFTQATIAPGNGDLIIAQGWIYNST